MPRNAAGTYSLPAGNPVVTGTTISSVWANTTLSDIGTALTGSLARNGDGGMTGQFKADAGAIGAPGIAWSTETTSGFYRAGAGDFRFAIAGVDVWNIGAGGASSLRYLAGDGTVALPAFSFTADPDTGIYRIGANSLGISAGGALSLTIGTSRNTSNINFELASTLPRLFLNDTDGAVNAKIWEFRANGGALSIITDDDAYGGSVTACVITRNAVADITSVVWDTVTFSTSRVFQTGDGAVGSPSHSFIADPDTGMYRSGANDLGFSAGGVNRFDISTTAVIFNSVPMQGLDGSVGAPAYSFVNDTNTGIYRVGADNVRISAGGIDIWGFANAAGTPLNQPFGVIQAIIDGSAASPVYSFNNDPDIGMYRGGANDLRFAVNGALALQIQPTFFAPLLPITATDGSAATPSYTFFSDQDTGIYRVGANAIGFATAGVLQFEVQNGGTVIRNGGLYVQDGSVGSPCILFANDQNTGFYRDTADQIAISLGGTTAGQIAQGSFTGTLTGCTTSPTATFSYQRVGKMVFLWCSANLTATSNATTMTVTGFPAIITPAVDTSCPGYVDSTDNGVAVIGMAVMRTTSIMAFFRNQVSGTNIINSTWTNSGTKGLNAGFCVSYPIT